MDEYLDQEQAGAAPAESELLLATVKSWSRVDGVIIQLDGDDQPLQKAYKQIMAARTLVAGSRVVVLKTSGTYIVLGQIGLPFGVYRPTKLASGATTAQIISKINELIDILRTAGTIRE